MTEPWLPEIHIYTCQVCPEINFLLAVRPNLMTECGSSAEETQLPLWQMAALLEQISQGNQHASPAR